MITPKSFVVLFRTETSENTCWSCVLFSGKNIYLTLNRLVIITNKYRMRACGRREGGGCSLLPCRTLRGPVFHLFSAGL